MENQSWSFFKGAIVSNECRLEISIFLDMDLFFLRSVSSPNSYLLYFGVNALGPGHSAIFSKKMSSFRAFILHHGICLLIIDFYKTPIIIGAVR